MNLIEVTNNLPDWQWKENSVREILITGEDLLETSDFVWQIGQVCVVGFIYSSLLSAPWMWFLLADKVTVADLVDFRRLAQMIPKGTMTAVGADFAVGLRFAKLYGFQETGEEIPYADRVYRVMRKV
jgi:hypothetical protein